MTTQLEDLVGQKLVIGFPGTKVTPEVIQQFKDTHAGGVIFYRINFESPDQIKTVLRDLEEALERRLLVCVDHEGGRVIMYRDGITVFPDNLTFGEARKIAYAKEAGSIAAKELRALGTDINFAPVLDVLTESYSPNIGIRSYGKDWKTVAEMGVAYIKALQQGGVSATAKHFPGKGHAPVDAHLGLPTIMSTWDDMQKIHLKPFIKAIEAGVDVVMSSHPKYPKLDPNPENIATFSRRIITDCLRDELKYEGVISSDDLEMGAIKDMCSIDVAAVKAVAAGHDLILSCHDYDSERMVYRGLLDAYRGKLLPINELEESVQRINALKKKRPNRFDGDLGPDPQGPPIAAKVSTEGVKILQNPSKRIPLSQTDKENVSIVFPALSSFAKKIMIEEVFENEQNYLLQKLHPSTKNLKVHIYPITPSEEKIDDIVNTTQDSNTVIFFCFDAHLHPNQGLLLATLQRKIKSLIVVLMRDPYDQEYIQPTHTSLTAFGFRECQIAACLKAIYGE